MSILDKMYIVTMPDETRYAVPVMAIAHNRAKYYAKEYDDNAARSLQEDTAPFFEDDHDEIADWARNNMDWEDVKLEAKQIQPPAQTDFQEGWVNGEWEIK